MVDPRHRPTHPFARDEIVRIVASDHRNRWIGWDEIARATLKRGVVDSSLHLELRDGRAMKFLWLRFDHGYELLEASLTRSLSDRFTAIDKAVG